MNADTVNSLAAAGIFAVAIGIVGWQAWQAWQTARMRRHEIHRIPAAPDNQPGTDMDALITCRRIARQPLSSTGNQPREEKP